MNVPVTSNITERSTAEQGDAAEDYEEPTDDCDREWPPVHGPQITRIRDGFTNRLGFFFCKVKHRRRVQALPSHRHLA